MSPKFIVIFLTLTLLLAACATPGSLPAFETIGTPRQDTPTPMLLTPYPLPQFGSPTSTPMTNPEPSSSESVAHKLPPSGYEPQPGDKNFARDLVYLDLANSHIVFSLTDPGQVSVMLQGNLPEACHKLRVVVSPPDASLGIRIEAYSVVDPASTCLAALEPFSASIPLGPFTSGKYSVVVNDEPLGEFSIPYTPQPADDGFTRGDVILDMPNSKLLTIGTQPIEAIAVLKGSLLNPCYQLRMTASQSNEKGAINLEIYSVVDPKAVCTEVLQPFEIAISLGSVSSGHIKVLVNGEVLGEIATGYEPQPGDENLSRGEAFVDLANSQLVLIDSQPGRASVTLRGTLPTPCHQLRVVVSQPDETNKIDLEVYSVVDPAVICITMVQPFEASIQLGSFSSGHYTVYVNGELLGEFDS